MSDSKTNPSHYRLGEYMIAYARLVDGIDEALSHLPEDCMASKVLDSAVRDGYKFLYPSEGKSNE